MHTKFHRKREIILTQNKPGNNESQFTDTRFQAIKTMKKYQKLR